MGSKWFFSYCFVMLLISECVQNSMKHFSFFYMRFFKVHVIHPYSSTDTATEEVPFYFCRYPIFIRSTTCQIVHAFLMRMLTTYSVDEILLPSYVNWSTNFRGLSLKMKMTPSGIKHMNFVLSEFTSRPFADLSEQCRRYSAWVNALARSARSS